MTDREKWLEEQLDEALENYHACTEMAMLAINCISRIAMQEIPNPQKHALECIQGLRLLQPDKELGKCQ